MFYVLIPKVWASIVDLLAPLEEVDEYQGIVEQLAEAVSFESQARADNLDIMPIQLAREVKSVKKGEAEEMPSLKAVSSFLKEVQKERSEVEEVQQDCEEREPVNSDGVEESFSRLGQEIAKFNTKYQVCSGSFSHCQHMIQCRFRVSFYPGCHQNHPNPRTGLRSTRRFRFCSPANESLKQSSLLRLSRGQRSSWKPHGGLQIRQLGWNKTKARLTNRFFSFILYQSDP